MSKNNIKICDATKAGLKGKFMALHAFIRKGRANST